MGKMAVAKLLNLCINKEHEQKTTFATRGLRGRGIETRAYIQSGFHVRQLDTLEQ